MIQATQLPTRYALSLSILSILQETIVPSMNLSLAYAYQAQGIASGSWLQFNPEGVILGDLPVSSDSIICVYANREENEPFATGGLQKNTFYTNIVLKQVDSVGNTPEDYEMVQSVFADACRDGLMNLQSYSLPSNIGTLNFIDCYIQSGSRYPPETGIDGKTMVRLFCLEHRALVTLQVPSTTMV